MTQQMMWCMIVPAVIWASIKIISDAYELYYIVKCDKDSAKAVRDIEAKYKTAGVKVATSSRTLFLLHDAIRQRQGKWSV